MAGLATICAHDTEAARELTATYEVERNKWDEVASAEMAAARFPLPYDNLSEYADGVPQLGGIPEFLGDLSGKRVLEYGCGMGKATVALARSGASVTCFDLSPRSIEVTRRRLGANGVTARPVIAAGESLPFDDDSFDVAYGESVLHHLDVRLAAPELQRVLRPGALVAFSEPMGMNPLLRFARAHLPYRDKTDRGADVPLSYEEIHAWGSALSHFSIRETKLLSMVERLWGWDKELRSLRRIDDFLLERFPRLGRYCRSVVIYGVR
jgi:SAM-dependent methyltransferase